MRLLWQRNEIQERAPFVLLSHIIIYNKRSESRTMQASALKTNEELCRLQSEGDIKSLSHMIVVFG